MNIVVSDSGPLRYLVETGHEGLLEALFTGIIVPERVLEELRHASAPDKVRRWAGTLPNWVTSRIAPPLKPDMNLDPGESEAIALAVEIRADLLIVDERAGRNTAAALGLNCMGTLGVLALASRRGLLNFEAALESLLLTNFRASDELIRKTRALANS
jgi:predicted nucleic acid-binding protein